MCVLCVPNVKMKLLLSLGGGVKVLKAMLQSGRTKTDPASSSCTLLGRVAISRALWLLIVCTDKQGAHALCSVPPWMFTSPEYFCYLTSTNVALIFDFKPTLVWSWSSVYLKQVLTGFFFF